MARWNKNQERVINWRNSYALVSAAAGSGKTAALIERILRLVIDDGVDVNKLIVVTFTKAAASEMKERLMKALESKIYELSMKENLSADEELLEERLEKQISLVNTALVCTIDSFCQYIIKNYFYAIDDFDPSFTVIDQNDNEILLTETVEKVVEGRYEEAADDVFINTVRMYSGWKSDDDFKSLIKALVKKALTHPQPEKWLDEVLFAYDVENEKWDEFFNMNSENYKPNSSNWMEFIFDFIENKISQYREYACFARKILVDGKETKVDEDLDEKKLKAALELLDKFIYTIDLDIDHFDRVLKLLEEKKDFNALCREMINFNVLPFDRSYSNVKEEKAAAKKYRDLYSDKYKKILDMFNLENMELMNIREDEYAKKKALNLDDENLDEALELKNLNEQIEYKEPIDIIKERFLKIYAYLSELIDTVKEVMASYAKEKKDRNTVDFNDMERFALRILTVEDENGKLCPSEVARELKANFKQIMIDEYQDSNLIQEAILTSISGESGEPYVFMVGDVKQSIYGFRHARPDLFLEKYYSYSPEEEFLDGDEDAPQSEREGKKILINLDRNYRSRIEVLEFTNEIFKKLMKREFGKLDYDERASLKYGELYDDSEYPVEVMLLDESDLRKYIDDEKKKKKLFYGNNEFSRVELEAITVGKRIRELCGIDGFSVLEIDGGTAEDGSRIKKKLEYKDIVLLFRGIKGVSDTYKDILERMDIPVFCEGTKGYYDRHEIQIVLNYLKIIENPLQDIPFVGVLRSAFVGLNEKELARIKAYGKKKYYYYEGALAYVEKHDNELSRKLKAFLDRLMYYRSIEKERNAYELINNILEDEGFFQLVSVQENGEKKAENLKILKKNAYDFIQRGNRGVAEFNKYIEDLMGNDLDRGEADISSDGSNAVRIMSIHKSKGLEFPVVILCGIHKDFNLKDSSGNIIIDNDLGLCTEDINAQLGVKTSNPYKMLVKEKISLDSKAEEQRLLYVALTRAKEKLIVTGKLNYNPNKTMTAQNELFYRPFDKIDNTVKFGYKDMDGYNNYYSWIVAGIYHRDAFKMAMEDYANKMSALIERINGEDENDGATESLELHDDDYVGCSSEKGLDVKFICCENIIDYGQKIIQGVEEEIERRNKEPNPLEEAKLLELIRAQREYQYPFENALKYPSKISVSALKKRAYEEASNPKSTDSESVNSLGENAIDEIVDLISENSNQKSDVELEGGIEDKDIKNRYIRHADRDVINLGATRGTVYHNIMAHIDFADLSKYDTIEKFERFIDSLLKKAVVTEDEKSLIDNSDFMDFFTDNNPIIGELMKAGEKKRIWCEQPFMKEYSSDRLFEGKDDFTDTSNKTVVQGVIDLWFINEDNKIILVDYKTDGLSSKGFLRNASDEKKGEFRAELIKRYQTQFDYYSDVLESMMGREVTERYIYSFSLLEVISVPIAKK